MPRAAGAVICMSCGHNSLTGGKIHTKVKKATESSKPSKNTASREVSYTWVAMSASVIGAVAVPVLASRSPIGLNAAMLAVVIWAFTSWVSMIVAAYRDDNSKWGIIGICTVAPCIGAIAWLFFSFYYCIFGSDRTAWKVNYRCSVAALITVYVVIFTQYPGLIEQYADPAWRN